jgi:hypothetical protein
METDVLMYVTLKCHTYAASSAFQLFVKISREENLLKHHWIISVPFRMVMCTPAFVCVCVCVGARARARVPVCARICARACPFVLCICACVAHILWASS